MKTWDAVIVGSGISGLTCAGILAKNGKSVVVLEQHSKPGGYMHNFTRFGRRFETGAHYIGGLQPGQPFHTILEYLQIFDASLFTPLREDGFDRFQFTSRSFTFSKGLESNTERLCADFPQETTAIRVFFESIKRASENFPTYSLRTDVDASIQTEYLSVSLGKFVDALTTNVELKKILFGYCVLHGVEPYDISFGLHALLVDSVLSGSYGLTHGGDSLARKFVEMIESHGGEVRVSCPVSRIVTEGRAVRGVETSGGTIRARNVVSSLHPKSTFRLVDPTLLPPLFKQRLDHVTESCGLMGIYGVSDTPVDLDPLTNVYFFEDRPVSPMFQFGSPRKSPEMCYLTRPDRGSIVEPPFPWIIHSPGPFKWFEEFKNSKLGQRPEAYRSLKSEIADQALQLVDRFVPGFTRRIRSFVTSSPLSNLHFNGNEEGSAYGIYHSMQNTGARSFGPPTHIEGLLLTGQSTLIPGLLGASIAGFRSAGHLLGLKHLIKTMQKGAQAS